jgi:peptidoglycan hydrolase-like protein with peptidoglycan-binding domain
MVSQTDAAGNTGTANASTTMPAVVVSSGGGGAVLIIPNNTSTPVTTNGNTNNLPTTGTNKTYISPLDNKVYACTPFMKYLKLNARTNDTNEVKLWQAFLNKHMNEKLPITGYYSTLTFSAIKRFQQNYREEVLTPWALTAPTGYTYKSTRAKGNKILGCPEGRVVLDNGIAIN